MGTAELLLIFASVSHTFNLPPGLLSGLCYVESNHNIQAIHPHDGNGTSVGICQTKLNTAKLLKFTGTQAQLMDPYINIYYAGKYLAKQIARYDGDIVKAVSAYNAGKHRPDSKGFPKNNKYVVKVFNAWAEGK